MRRKAPHAMTQGAPSHPPAGSPGPTMPPCRQRASSKAFPDLRKLRGRTPSWNLQPAIRVRPAQRATESNTTSLCRSSHGRKREGPITGAIDTKVLESQSLGCSQALLYNAVRPHLSLGYRPPAPEATLPPARGLPYATLRAAHGLPKAAGLCLADWYRYRGQTMSSPEDGDRTCFASLRLLFVPTRRSI